MLPQKLMRRAIRRRVTRATPYHFNQELAVSVKYGAGQTIMKTAKAGSSSTVVSQSMATTGLREVILR